MAVSMQQRQALGELAGVLYDFLPNKPHPYADPSLSIPGTARDLDLMRFYSGGSKRPALTSLLIGTLESRPDRFCSLVLEIVKRGMVYLENKKQSLHREDVVRVNEIVRKAGFKIPDLWDPAFLDSLPRRSVTPPEPAPAATPEFFDSLQQSLMQLGQLGESARGNAFEQLLGKLFAAFALGPRASFRLVGEQIDGSFELDGETYLLEAKFHSQPLGPSFLREFRDKVEGKARWSRGVLVAWAGFTDEGLQAFNRGRATNAIGCSGQDLFFVLQGQIALPDALRRKVRRAAETGEFYVPVQELLLGN